MGAIVFKNNFITEDNATGGYLLFISTNKFLDEDNPAIDLLDNVNKDSPASIIFSRQGLIKVQNNAKFKEISGYALTLKNNTKIVYEKGLADSNFSVGPGAGWQIKSWREVQ